MQNTGKTKLTEEELNKMSYQDLRRLSILLRLPANIKKEYMVKMIQAHQEGDETTKKQIGNRVKQDREHRRLNSLNAKIKRGKQSLMFGRDSTQQVPTDLSVSSNHEFYSYVAHYTAKKSPEGISEIIKEEAEVSRRNQNGGIVHQTRKSTRKLSAAGKREIMLPKNHSLTTLVRLEPEHERNLLTQTSRIPNSSVGESNWTGNMQYEPVSSPSESEEHFQRGSDNTYGFGNLPISSEYPNFLASSTSHDLYRSQPYWHARESCSSNSVAVVSNGLPASSTVTSSHDSSISVKSSSFQQETYKRYIRYNASEREFSGSDETRINSSKQNDFGDYVNHRLDENSSMGESDSCEQFQFRDGNSVIRHTNNQNESFVMDIFLPTPPEENGNFLRVENGSSYDPEINMFDSSATGTKNGNHENPYGSQGRNSTFDKRGGEYPDDERETGRDSDEIQKSDSVSSNMSIVSSLSDSSSKEMSEEDAAAPKLSNASKCRYSFGHNQYPDPDLSNKSSEGENSLPPFMTLLSSINHDVRGYSTCRNSFTGTTPTHSHPIMTSVHAANYGPISDWAVPNLESSRSQPPSPEDSTSNNINEMHYPRWLYSYQEPGPESPYSSDGNGFAFLNEAGKLMQILHCRRHGCHVYPVAGNPQLP